MIAATALARGTSIDWEDVAQATLEHVVRHFDQFRPGSNLIPWANVICRNVYVDMLRRKYGTKLQYTFATLDALPERYVEANQEDRILCQELVGRLRDDLQDYVMNELTHEEVTQKYGHKTRNASKSALFKQRKKFEEAMA